MKVICVREEKSLEVGKLYKVKDIRKIDKSLLYKIELTNEVKWVDSKKFKYPMSWVKS
jgi:hypothetical protein